MEGRGDLAPALRWAFAATDRAQDFTTWQAAAAVVRRSADAGPEPKRTARLALLGSYTTGQLATLLWLAALRVGVRLDIHEAPYAQYRQELIDPESATYAFDPELILLAMHAGELALPCYSASPADDVAAEARALAVALAHCPRALAGHGRPAPVRGPARCAVRAPGRHARRGRVPS